MDEEQDSEFVNMTYLERLDVEDRIYQHEVDLSTLKHEHELRLAQERTRQVELDSRRRLKELRSASFQRVGVALAILSLVLGIIWSFIYVGTRPETPTSFKTTDTYAQQRCVADHGVWVPKDLLDDRVDDNSLCLYPGKPVKDQLPGK